MAESGMEFLSESLFETLPAFVPCWLPGETLFSWAARYHRMSGNVQAARSSRQLFGSSRAGLRHDFPWHLDQLVRNTAGALGSAEAIAFNGTLLGFFRSFTSAERTQSVVHQMQGASGAKVKTTLGLMPSRMGAMHPLKACPECVEADLREFGFARWKVEHQWPSAWVCTHHGGLLRAVRNQKALRALNRYLLPEDLSEAEWIEIEGLGRDRVEVLERLARYSQALVDSGQAFRPDVTRFAALKEAAKRDWIATDGSMRFREVRAAFGGYYCGLESVPGFDCLSGVGKEHGGVLGMLLRKFPCYRHPTKWILLCALFFKSPGEFRESYREAELMINAGAVSEHGAPLNLEWRKMLRKRVEIEGVSITATAAELGVSVTQAIDWATKDGVKFKRRPRVLTDCLKQAIVERMREGQSATEIALKVGIRPALVRVFAVDNPAIGEEWHAARFERDRKRRRSAFLALLAATRGVPLSRVRQLPGSGYLWLARHDREWLLATLPLVSSR